MGRKPRTDALNLEAQGVKLQEKSGAVMVNTHLQTNVPHIFGLGDVTNRLQLTPMALNEGVAVSNFIFAEQEKVKLDGKKIENVHMEGEDGIWIDGLGASTSDHRLVPTAVFA